MKETWLITGGAGFIGGNFVGIAHGLSNHNMLVLDKLTYAGDLGRLGNLLDSPRVKFIHGDICNVALVRDIFKTFNIYKVIHFAAETHVDRSIHGPRDFIATNIDGTLNLLEQARTAWMDRQGKIFLHVSTDEVFGALKPDDPPFSEDSPYHPNSPYAASKASADHLVRAWFNTYNTPTIITNCSNNYGPWQYPEKLIPLIILNAWEGKELPIYGDGLQIRDWLHVDDHCLALLKVLTNGVVGHTYAIGGNEERSNISIVNAICDAVDQIKGQGESTRSLLRYVLDRPGHDRRYAINSSKIQRELGWLPQRNLSSALPELVRWYIGKKTWVDQVRSGEFQEFYKKHYAGRITTS